MKLTRKAGLVVAGCCVAWAAVAPSVSSAASSSRHGIHMASPAGSAAHYAGRPRPKSGGDGGNSRSRGSWKNNGNSRNSGNYKNKGRPVNSGNYSNVYGSISSNNSVNSANNANGPQCIIVRSRKTKTRC